MPTKEKEQPKTTNQLVDNSTIKEVAKFIYKKDEAVNKTAVVDNLLVLTHAAIVGKEINFIGSGRADNFLNDEEINKLNETLNKKLAPLNYNKRKEDQTVLAEARRDVKEYIIKHPNSFNNIFKKNIKITSLMDEEIKMYLGEGFDHYWTNVGGDPKPEGLYNAFNNAMENNFEKSVINQIDEYYLEYYQKKYPKLFKEVMKKNNVKEYRWLPLLSHIVRSQYYITITTKEDVIYNPLNARKRFSNGLLNTALESTTNQTEFKTNKRNQLLYWSFNYLLKKSKYEKKNFLNVLTDVTTGTDKVNPIKDISQIFQEFSILNFMSNGDLKKKKEKQILRYIKEFDLSSKIKTTDFEFVTKFSDEEKERVFAKDGTDEGNLGIGTILISNNTELIKKLGYDFNNKFLKQ